LNAPNVIRSCVSPQTTRKPLGEINMLKVSPEFSRRQWLEMAFEK
jgi:hypothetical protein